MQNSCGVLSPFYYVTGLGSNQAASFAALLTYGARGVGIDVRAIYFYPFVLHLSMLLPCSFPLFRQALITVCTYVIYVDSINCS